MSKLEWQLLAIYLFVMLITKNGKSANDKKQVAKDDSPKTEKQVEDKKEQRIFQVLPCYREDILALEAWLENMAAEGYMLKKFRWNGAVFVECEPVQVRYRFLPAPENKLINMGEPTERDNFIARHGENEWAYITSSGSLFVFLCRKAEIPEPKRETVRNMRWKDPPPVPKGWEIIKSTLFNGVNPVTGYPYQRYMIRRTHDSQHLHPPDNQRTKEAAGVRNLHPGGNHSAGPGNKDLQGSGRGERKRSMADYSWISAESHDLPFGS